jgi:uncharacterized membrane protein
MVKTSSGLEENIAGLLCYVVGWLTGLLFILLEKENKFVRFHAFQSIATFAPLHILQIILGGVGLGTIGYLVGILALVLGIILIIKAYKGERYKLPFVGDWAEKQVQ